MTGTVDSPVATSGAPAYFTAYENVRLTRTASGVLTVAFHTDGGPVVFTGQLHEDFPKLLAQIGDDRTTACWC
jgi:patatin-like phospholipase/acyl hydrolase